jgi:hypothetical protein
MDSLVLIERLDALMAEAKPIPFTREARVDRDEVYKILDRIRTTLPVEFERARWTGREDSTEDAVEAQLRQIGASIAELRRAQRADAEQAEGPPLTAAAAEQVREIVEAAERTAEELERDANAEAQRLRADAARDLKQAREESERILRESRERAAAEAAEYLRGVEEATQKMLERAAAADSEINGMLARLRGSGGSVMEDIEAIMSDLTQIEVRRNGGPKQEAQKTPERPSGEPAVRAAGGGGAGTATVALRPPQPGAGALARRPTRPAAVEGLEEPPEAPAVGSAASARASKPAPPKNSSAQERPDQTPLHREAPQGPPPAA